MRYAGWLVLAHALGCGRIGFDELRPGSNPNDGRPNDGIANDASHDGMTGDAAMSCIYLDSCLGNQVTCCTATATTCIPKLLGCAGTVAECDLTTSQGCNVASGATCCQAGADAAAKCYPAPAPC